MGRPRHMDRRARSLWLLALPWAIAVNAVAVCAAAHHSLPDWRLLAALLALATLSELPSFSLSTASGKVHVSGGLTVFAVAILLLGTGWGCVVGVVGVLAGELLTRRRAEGILCNAASYATIGLAAGAAADALALTGSHGLGLLMVVAWYLVFFEALSLAAACLFAWTNYATDPRPMLRAWRFSWTTALMLGVLVAATIWLNRRAGPDALAILAACVLVATGVMARLVNVEVALRTQRDRAQILLDVTATLFVELDTAAHVTMVNRAAQALLADADELLGGAFVDTMIAPGDRDRVAQALADADEHDIRFDAAMPSAHHGIRQISWHVCPFRSPDGSGRGMLLSGEDVTDQRAAQAKLEDLAYRDPLTGVPNRRAFIAALSRQIAQDNAHATAVLFCDLDRFKMVNDSLGHAAGDELLRQIVSRLGGCVRDCDLVARQSGDEFLIFLGALPADETSARRETQRVAQRVRRAIQQTFNIDGVDVSVDVSVGVAVCPFDAPDAEALIAHADEQMYERKLTGRGQQPASSSAREQLTFVARMQRALTHDEFVLHYQPIVGRDQQVLYHEALVRWQDPELGLLAPGEFIAQAEKTGMIDRLGDWVLRRAVAQAALWQAAGVPAGVAVNVSARQLIDDSFPARVQSILNDHDVDAGLLIVEITESLWLQEDMVAASLNALAAMGVALAIDDFGAGFASLTRLRSFSASIVKVDRAYICDVPDDQAATRALGHLVGLGRAYGLQVVVEGVESAEQASHLIALDGDVHLQGYWIARPGPSHHHISRQSAHPAAHISRI